MPASLHLFVIKMVEKLRGCFKSPILCHAERSVSPPDDLRYAKRVLSISVYVQNPRFYSPSGICSANVLLRSTQNDKLYPVRLFKHPLIWNLLYSNHKSFVKIFLLFSSCSSCLCGSLIFTNQIGLL
jgi:hypothetical protein